MDDELQALLLLNFLHDSWQTLVMSLSNSVPDSKVHISTVTTILLNEEIRRESSAAFREQGKLGDIKERGKRSEIQIQRPIMIKKR